MADEITGAASTTPVGRGLSVIVITRNEAANIRACLESVAWAGEIVVVDSGSSDGTAEICREMGARVFVCDWPGFGIQKNRALDHSTREWVFSIDADERVTPELRAAIEAVLADTDNAHAAYEISRLSSYCGRFMRHSGWYPDRIVRLFRRDAARFSDDLVHERLRVEGRTGLLDGELLHYAFDDLEEVLRKVNQYSSAGAAMMQRRGRQASLSGAVLRGLWSFFRTYVLRGGFLDGREGFMLAVSNAEGTYYRYLKLMLLNRKS
ncbi:MAG: glycosyltransferase family 2 protein [Nitrosomonadales bacterium]|nr:glycosyltransferase family 2 protein [Nitrosomonadales bacterium]MBK9162204.1 glycosyltransferase family 2 protein [Nitrosomonadales bacterium]